MSSPTKRPVRVFLFSTRTYPFIQDDVDLLREEFEVDAWWGRGIGAVLKNLAAPFRSDVTISWFGSVYTFFLVVGSGLAGARSIVILGGVDAAREPGLEYGIWRSRWKGELLKWGLHRADVVYAVDGSLRRSLEEITGREWSKIQVLPTGYDPDRWRPDDRPRDGVLTVAHVESDQRLRIKGIDLLIEAARHLPDLRFTVVGIEPSVERELGALPPNLHLRPPIDRVELPELYRRARIYCQPSRREGLPNALCEAMLSGCIPVGSDAGGIAGAIGETGFVAPVGDLESLVAALGAAAGAPGELGEAARERALELFSREKRRERLVATVRRLAGRKVWY